MKAKKRSASAFLPRNEYTVTMDDGTNLMLTIIGAGLFIVTVVLL